MGILQSLFGLTPDQVSQYGVAIVSLIVMASQISLFVFIFKNIAANDKARNEREKLAETNQKNIAKELSDSRAMFASVMITLEKSRSEQMVGTRNFVEELRQYNRDSVDAVGGIADRTEKFLDKGREMMLKAVENVAKRADLEKAVTASIANQNENHKVVTGKLDVIDQKVTHLAPYGEVIYRIEQDLQAIHLTLEHTQAAETAVTALRHEIDPRLLAVEEGFAELRKIIPVLPPPPSLDEVATQSAALKRKTEPIPAMPIVPILPDSSDAQVADQLKQAIDTRQESQGGQ